MNKKTLRNIIILVGIAVLAFLVWFIFFRSTADDSLVNRDRDGLSNPFGDFLPGDRVEQDADDDIFEFETRDSKLRLLSASPVSGYKFFDREVVLENNSFEVISTSTATTSEELSEQTFSTTTETIVQYVSRSNGNIFEINSNENDTLRVTNTTIPRVQKATFLNDLNNVFYTTLDQSDNETIVTYLAEFDEYNEIMDQDSSTTTSTSTIDFPIQLEGFFLTDNIKDLLVSPNDDVFVFLQNKESFNTFSVGYLFEGDDVENPEIVFQSEISDFNPEWINENNIAFTTKPSYLSEGFSYVLDLESGEVEKRLGRKIALSTKYSPDNSKIIYSELLNGLNTLKLFVEEDNNDLDLGIFTLADKCTWSEDSIFIYCAIPSNPGALSLPDVWYRGEYNFDDVVIEINTETFENRFVLRREDRPSQFDIYNMTVSENGEYLVFQNRIDLSLWMLDLTE